MLLANIALVVVRAPHGQRSRGIAVVLSDGSVTTCCADVRGELGLGHIDDAPLPELYQSSAWRELRRRHQQGDLPPVCARCSECQVPTLNI